MKNRSAGCLGRLFCNAVTPESRSPVAVVAGLKLSSMTSFYNGKNPSICLRGFTLIELLVVVLIIGILSAVALPQYTKAVAKSRFVQLQMAGKSLKDAMEVYYMTNGEYPQYWWELSVKYPGCLDGGGRYMLWCDKFVVDMFAGPSPNLVLWDTHGIPDNGKNMNTGELDEHASSKYIIWLDYSENPSKTECVSKIAGLCQSLGY